MKSEWTPEQDAALRRLWDDGLTSAAIGAAMRRTKNSVIGRAHRLGLTPRLACVRPAELGEEAEWQRDAIRQHWFKSLDKIRSAAKLGTRRVLAIGASLGLPARDTFTVSPAQSARVSGARRSASPGKARVATTRTSLPCVRGADAVVSLPPPGQLNLPAVAPLDALKQRRVFLGRHCKTLVNGDGEAARFCDLPVIASAKGQNCASPYCLEHYALFYIGTNKDLGNPGPLRWR